MVAYQRQPHHGGCDEAVQDSEERGGREGGIIEIDVLVGGGTLDMGGGCKTVYFGSGFGISDSRYNQSDFRG